MEHLTAILVLKWKTNIVIKYKTRIDFNYQRYPSVDNGPSLSLCKLLKSHYMEFIESLILIWILHVYGSRAQTHIYLDIARMRPICIMCTSCILFKRNYYYMPSIFHTQSPIAGQYRILFGKHGDRSIELRTVRLHICVCACQICKQKDTQNYHVPFVQNTRSWTDNLEYISYVNTSSSYRCSDITAIVKEPWKRTSAKVRFPSAKPRLPGWWLVLSLAARHRGL